MKKKQSRDLEEAVAAKLSGRELCPTCLGSGESLDFLLNGKRTDCSRCGGKKWIRKELEKYKDA